MVTVYKFRKIIGKTNFSEQLKKIVTRYKTICYNMDILRQNEYMVVNPVTIDNLTINDCVIGPGVFSIVVLLVVFLYYGFLSLFGSLLFVTPALARVT